MTTLYACAPGAPLARLSARAMLDTIAPDALPRAVVFVPTRRALISLRQAFQDELAGSSAMLPRMVALAGIDQELVGLLGTSALAWDIPPSMPAWQQRDILTQHVAAFMLRRHEAARIDQALALADELMALQDECARQEVALTPQALRALAQGDFAQHWEVALQFLGIVAQFWPAVEAELNLTIAAARETKILRALATHWATTPPDYPVWIIGSTASQPATAALMKVVMNLTHGAVVLPGIEPSAMPQNWAEYAPGHPLYHMGQLLAQSEISPHALQPLGTHGPSIWLEALADQSIMAQWASRPLPAYAHLRLMPCQHAEEEARVIALLMRESVAENKRTALITPDEGLMARVQTHLQRFGLQAQQLRSGNLAQTEAGSVWLALLSAIREPHRLLHVRHLLHHPLVQIAADFLRAIEPYWHGAASRRVGQLPRMPEAVQQHHAMTIAEKLTREVARLANVRLNPPQWLAQLRNVLALLDTQEGASQHAVDEALEVLEHSQLGPMVIEEFYALAMLQLAEPVRSAGLRADARLMLLTPVEARLEQFDRVILANMQEKHWPGIHKGGAWLNMAARARLGLPDMGERISLMAHDVLMLGSGAEVFLTWPQREEGAPTTRSRFIERLVTLLAMHGIDEAKITESRYHRWASLMDTAADFTPATPPRPMPNAQERPRRLPVSALDVMASDPYGIYARFVLGLRPLKAIDAEPEPSDFGSLAHRAIKALTDHWNAVGAAPSEATLEKISQRALSDFSDQPGIALFWRTRLLRALQFVNAEEIRRRAIGPLTVGGEIEIEAPLALADEKTITLHGRMDRVEQGSSLLIADYKTGHAAGSKEMLSGEALQLLAYAMLMQAQGGAPQAIEYWKLPQARQLGAIHHAALTELEAAGTPEGLRDLLAAMLDEASPFLAKPGGDVRNDDYDGISRYDEWAG